MGWYGILGDLPYYHGMAWDLGLVYHIIADMGRDLNGISHGMVYSWDFQWDGIFVGYLIPLCVWDGIFLGYPIPLLSHCIMTRM